MTQFITSYRGWDVYFDGKEELTAGDPQWTLIYSPLPQTSSLPQQLRGQVVWLHGGLSLREVKCCIDYIMGYSLSDNVRHVIASYLRHILAISAGS